MLARYAGIFCLNALGEGIGVLLVCSSIESLGTRGNDETRPVSRNTKWTQSKVFIEN
jgi:hypothetical protein